MGTKLTLIVLMMLGAGCELAGPLLIGEAIGSDDDGLTGAGMAALSVEIESASGTVAGQPLAAEMFTATGDRFGSQVNFQLRTESGDLEVLVISDAESSSTNPYTGEGGGFDEGGSGGSGGVVPIEDPSGFPSEAFADVTVCQGGSCRSATDFGVELVQTQDGRNATVDGVWGPEESVQITLHYTEVR